MIDVIFPLFLLFLFSFNVVLVLLLLFWFILSSILYVNVYVSVSYPLIFFFWYRIRNKSPILCQLFWPTLLLWKLLLWRIILNYILLIFFLDCFIELYIRFYILGWPASKANGRYMWLGPLPVRFRICFLKSCCVCAPPRNIMS